MTTYGLLINSFVTSQELWIPVLSFWDFVFTNSRIIILLEVVGPSIRDDVCDQPPLLNKVSMVMGTPLTEWTIN